MINPNNPQHVDKLIFNKDCADIVASLFLDASVFDDDEAADGQLL